MVNEELQFYVDTLVLETILSNPRLSKNAQSGMVSSLLQKVFQYTHEKIKDIQDSDHKIEMITNFLIPGMLTAFGFPFLGFLSKIGQMVFHIDFAKILGDIASSVKSLIVGGKQASSGEVDSVVNKVVMNNYPPEPTETDINKFLPAQERVVTNKLTLREAHLIKIAFADYALNNPEVNLHDPEMNVKFAAGLFQSALASFLSSRHKTMKILISVLGWMVKAILASAGFMVAGDAINKIVGGTTNPIDGSQQSNKTEPTSVMAPPTQNIFKVNPGYVTENNNGPYARWMIQVDPNTIDNLLVSWTTDIYPDLKGQESAVRSSRTFQSVADVIKAYNAGGPSNVTFIPRQWKSRKQVVDNFMAELASTIHKDAPPVNNGQKPALEV